MSLGPKAESVREDGTPDGWSPEPGWFAEMTPRGETRLVVSVPVDRLHRAHTALIGALKPPLGFLYRQRVDRRNPRPQGAPPRDFVGLQLEYGRIQNALHRFQDLVYHDARCEVWVRGTLDEQIVLDEDGVIWAYPDDPAFRDALNAVGVHEKEVQHTGERDYVKHWFHAQNDVQEDELIASLGLTSVAPQRAG